MSKVSLTPIKDNIEKSVEEVFAAFGGLPTLLRGRTKAYVKVNAIDARPETYTSPTVLEAVLKVLKDDGVKKTWVIENCTQGNFTRLVFATTDIGAVCRRQGAIPMYLDEEPVVELELPGLDQSARFPRRLVTEFFGQDRQVFYLNLPKLKTHSMSVLTLGIKNQLGLMDQRDRMHEHNYNLHNRLVAVTELFCPDFTIIDGVNAVFHGHYPPTSMLSRCLAPLNVLIGGQDVLAVDTVAARVLGYSLEEVEHLRLARERKLGCCDLAKIQILGDLSPYNNKKYPHYLLPDMPPDVRIVRGKERCCTEGCGTNPLAVLQLLYLDYHGKGGFAILMGKGFEQEQLAEIEGPLFLAGKCAIEETHSYFSTKMSPKQIFMSPSCNDLASTMKALTKLMKVNPLSLAYASPLKSLGLLLVAKLKGSKARVAL